MPRRHDDLFGGIASFQALREAALQAVRGKRRKPGAAAFFANLEKELLRLERALTEGTWSPGGYRSFEVHDPKPRMVSAAPFRDRVVHHALCSAIEPIFERGFIADSYANRTGKGTHRAVARYEHFRDRYRYVLRGDIYRYFPAIDHEILKRALRRRIACPRTLWLIDAIIDGSNPQEPVELYFPGDDLFAPTARRRGLPIGNLTSQLFANIYLVVGAHQRFDQPGRHADDLAGDIESEELMTRGGDDGFVHGRLLGEGGIAHVRATERRSAGVNGRPWSKWGAPCRAAVGRGRGAPFTPRKPLEAENAVVRSGSQASPSPPGHSPRTANGAIYGNEVRLPNAKAPKKREGGGRPPPDGIAPGQISTGTPAQFLDRHSPTERATVLNRKTYDGL